MSISRSHPNFWDKVAVKIYPRYLYTTQFCHTLATVNVNLLHHEPNAKTSWKIADNVYLKKDSTLRFIGLVKKLKGFNGLDPYSSIFVLVNPQLDELKSSGKHVSSGDTIFLTPFDRRFIVAAPDQPLPDSAPLFYTAADQ